MLASLATAVVPASGCASLVGRENLRTEVSELRSGDCVLDRDHAYPLLRVEHLGLSTVVGCFNAVDATLDVDPDDLAGLRLDGVVNAASIDLLGRAAGRLQATRRCSVSRARRSPDRPRSRTVCRGCAVQLWGAGPYPRSSMLPGRPVGFTGVDRLCALDGAFAKNPHGDTLRLLHSRIDDRYDRRGPAGGFRRHRPESAG